MSVLLYTHRQLHTETAHTKCPADTEADVSQRSVPDAHGCRSFLAEVSLKLNRYQVFVITLLFPMMMRCSLCNALVDGKQLAITKRL